MFIPVNQSDPPHPFTAMQMLEYLPLLRSLQSLPFFRLNSIQPSPTVIYSLVSQTIDFLQNGSFYQQAETIRQAFDSPVEMKSYSCEVVYKYTHQLISKEGGIVFE